MTDTSVSEKLAEIEKNLRAPGMDECWGTASDFYHNVGSLKWHQAEHIALCSPDTMRRIAADHARLVELLTDVSAIAGYKAEIDRLKAEREKLQDILGQVFELIVDEKYPRALGRIRAALKDTDQ